MVEYNPTNSLPASEPVPTRRTRSLRTRETHSTQDDVPHHAADRRQPDRMAVALERARLCARIADDNRARDIVLLDLRKATALVDFFLIVTAGSRRQSHAIAGEIDQEMKRRGEAKLGIEESEEGRWTLIDYGDFVVHLFSPEDRAYYALEDIWGDAPHLDWQEPPAGERGSGPADTNEAKTAGQPAPAAEERDEPAR
jgi:ribosome-associated protein